MSEEKLTHEYLHSVRYYETDAMRIVHHSNYFRWMEDARLDFFEKVGLAYYEIEKTGILVPVIGASCEYKIPAVYGDRVRICAELERFNGIKFSVLYRIMSEDGEVLHATGRTEHCFLDKDMRPVNIKKTAPEIYAVFAPYKM